jgi:four helix bundle protein
LSSAVGYDFSIDMRDFKNLAVWKKAHQLTLDIYGLTAGFPRDELFGLTSQIKRASSSIAANIAEGCGRDTPADFSRFLTIAMGSASELESHLLLARDLGLMKPDQFAAVEGKTVEVKKMLAGLLQRLKD